MPTDDSDMRAQVRTLTDRAELAALCDGYVAHLDHSRDSDTWFSEIFTEDVHLVYPMGEYKGHAGVAEFQVMARSTFARTHHMAANYRFDLDGDRAGVRAHLTASHLPDPEDPATRFAIGGHFEAEAVRTEAGWRIREFVFDLVWRVGPTPAALK